MSGIQERTAVPTPTERRRGRRHIGKQARERLLAAMPVTERRLEVAGISTAVLQGGSGPPVVLLHGPGEYAAKWMRVIPGLVTTHRVVAPDLPGHGTTGVSDSPLDIDSVLGWLGELIERTCPTAPVLVGHILGGAIASRFAREYGDQLRQLVLVDSLGLGTVPANAGVRACIEQLHRRTDRGYPRPSLAPMRLRSGWPT